MKKSIAIMAVLMLLLSMPLAALAADFWPSSETGIDTLWIIVPWEDKGKDVTFGIRCNTHEAKSALGGGSIVIDILEKGTAKWNAQFAQLDAQSVESDSLMLLDIVLLDNEGNEMDAAGLNLTMLIQNQSEWEGKAPSFVYISAGADEAFSYTKIYDPAPADDILGEYLSIAMPHFSPYAMYVAAAQQPAPVAPPANVPATGDGSLPMLWAALLVMGGAAMLLLKRKKA